MLSKFIKNFSVLFVVLGILFTSHGLVRFFHDVSHFISSVHFHEHENGESHSHAHFATHESDTHDHVIQENEIQLFIGSNNNYSPVVSWVLFAAVMSRSFDFSILWDTGPVYYRSTSPPGPLVTQVHFFVPSHTAPPSNLFLV